MSDRYVEAQALIRAALDPSSPSVWPPRAPASALDARTIAGSLDSAGCLWVERLVDADFAGRLRDGIDRAFAGYDVLAAGGYGSVEEAYADATPDPWFTMFIPEPGAVHSIRPWARLGSGVFTADSPIVADLWFGFLVESGLVDLLAEVFGERPITSLDKCTLRRVEPGGGIEWHQDGAFLGAYSGAVNLWVTLSDCRDAPSLDLVPRRLPNIVETGTGGATYDWSVGPEVVAELLAGEAVSCPPFALGDALLFDGFLLHQTQHTTPARGTRYAIETWFFRPSRFPDHQTVPLAL